MRQIVTSLRWRHTLLIAIGFFLAPALLALAAPTRFESIIISMLGVGTAQTPGITLDNPTPATSGNQQYSPMLKLCGNGYKTDATAGSQAVCWGLQTRPAQAAAAPTQELVFWDSVNGAAYQERVVLRVNVGGTAYLERLSGARLQLSTAEGAVLSPSGNGGFGAQNSYAWMYVGATGIDMLSGEVKPSGNGTVNLGATARQWNTTFSRHYASGQSAKPTIAASSGAGTGGTCAVVNGSTDSMGEVKITTGTTPSANAVVCTLTFNTAWNQIPRCLVGPSDVNANYAWGHTQPLHINAATATTTAIEIKTYTALDASLDSYYVFYKCEEGMAP